MKEITLAGGCFWGVEAYFQRLKGVVDTTVGYVDGNIEKPTYRMLVNGLATHVEAVKVIYDENIVGLTKILEHYFNIINPFALNKQGNDVGIQYRTAIFYKDEEDLKIIENYMIKRFKDDLKNVKTYVSNSDDFYDAEEEHQDYLKKNPDGYCHIDLSDLKGDDYHEA